MSVFFSFLLSVFEEGEELAVVDGADGGDGAELCGDDGRGECGQLDGGEGECVGVSAGPACRGVGDGGGGEDGGQGPYEGFECVGGEDALAGYSHVQVVGYFDAACACGRECEGECSDGGYGEHDAGGSLPVAGVEVGVGAEHGVGLFGLGGRGGSGDGGGGGVEQVFGVGIGGVDGGPAFVPLLSAVDGGRGDDRVGESLVAAVVGPGEDRADVHDALVRGQVVPFSCVEGGGELAGDPHAWASLLCRADAEHVREAGGRLPFVQGCDGHGGQGDFPAAFECPGRLDGVGGGSVGCGAGGSGEVRAGGGVDLFAAGDDVDVGGAGGPLA